MCGAPTEAEVRALHADAEDVRVDRRRHYWGRGLRDSVDQEGERQDIPVEHNDGGVVPSSDGSGERWVYVGSPDVVMLGGRSVDVAPRVLYPVGDADAHRVQVDVREALGGCQHPAVAAKGSGAVGAVPYRPVVCVHDLHGGVERLAVLTEGLR